MSRSEIYLNYDRVLNDTEKKQLEKKIKKRIDKIPLQYITKHQEFRGMDFLVEKGVLIPRPETEILVNEVIKRLKNCKYSNNLKVVDLGTGTGIIAICIAKFIEYIIIYAIDISKKPGSVSACLNWISTCCMIPKSNGANQTRDLICRYWSCSHAPS